MKKRECKATLFEIQSIAMKYFEEQRFKVD